MNYLRVLQIFFELKADETRYWINRHSCDVWFPPIAFMFSVLTIVGGAALLGWLGSFFLPIYGLGQCIVAGIVIALSLLAGWFLIWIIYHAIHGFVPFFKWIGSNWNQAKTITEREKKNAAP